MENSRILVIGGAGYIGSHFTRLAADRGFVPTVMDNLSEGHRAAVQDAEFFQADLLDGEAFRDHLASNRYGALVHFAANCLVGESVANPEQYYRNNVVAAFNMLEAMKATGHDRVVFSSTCAVYGMPEAVPIGEECPKAPISPYGRSKLAIEWMLEDFSAAYGIRAAIFRYFNAAGCEPEHGLGEDHRPETHLIPAVVRAALDMDKELVIFGDDYPTPDGTCIRDYIHVSDLADAHLKALDKLDGLPLIQLNLGTGVGFSNLQVLDAVKRISGKPLTPKIGPRRLGDPPELIADASRARTVLDWKPVRTDLDRIVAEVLQWFTENPRGYGD